MSSTVIDNKIVIYIGNSEEFELEVTDEGYIFQRKNSFAGGDDTEIKITDGGNGLAEIYLIPDNTKDLLAGIYVYDVWVKLTSGLEKTVVQNRLFLEDSVKKPE